MSSLCWRSAHAFERPRKDAHVPICNTDSYFGKLREAHRVCQNDEDESGEDEESSDSEKGSANGDAGATQDMLMDAMPIDDDP